MKFMLLILVLCTSSLSFSSYDFIEGQMKFKVLPSGKKDFTYTWDQENAFLQIRLGLVWDNYEEELHGHGFNLSDIRSSYQVFPDPPENCTYYKAHGSVQGKTDLQNNEIFVEYKGEGCQEMLNYFSFGTFVIHFYNVSSWAEPSIKTEVFRLQLWDYAAP